MYDFYADPKDLKLKGLLRGSNPGPFRVLRGGSCQDERSTDVLCVPKPLRPDTTDAPFVGFRILVIPRG
jgi:hypothetical protein